MTDTEAVKQTIAGIFDRASETYDQNGVEFFQVVARNLIDLADIQPGERVLELGCGRGAATLQAAQEVGPEGHVHAIDLAPGMVERLRSDLDAAGQTHVTVAVGDAERPDVEPGSVDLVLASLVLFFLPDHQRAIRSYRDLLRPGGRLAFSWFGVEDHRWDPIFESLVAELPKESHGPRRPGAGGPFESQTAMDAFLTEAGWTPTTTLRPLTVFYPDEDTWWATLWSHGRRATMEKLRDAGVLESTMRRLSADLDAVRTLDGQLEWTAEMAYTIARPA